MGHEVNIPQMHHYNSDHPTGVIAYGYDNRSITVLFQDGEYYLYDHEKPGLHYVKEMIKHAKNGKGLSGYISQHPDVRNNFKQHWRRDGL